MRSDDYARALSALANWWAREETTVDGAETILGWVAVPILTLHSTANPASEPSPAPVLTVIRGGSVGLDAPISRDPRRVPVEDHALA